MTQTFRNSVQGLDPRQVLALAGLVAGRKPSDVAAEVGISARQLHRWRTEDPAFAAALAEAQADTVDAGRIRLGGLLDSALDAIESVLRDDGAPAAARLRAAELVLARVGLDAPKPDAAVNQGDVGRVLAFMQWEQEQANVAG